MKLIASIAVIATAWALTSTSIAAPKSYPLLCKGGPGMKIMVNHDVNGAGIPGDAAMFIHFTPASAPGSERKPNPGQCVWLDRTFRSGEPAVLWIKSPTIKFAFQVKGDGRIVVDTRGPRLSVEGSTRSAEAKKWQYLIDGVMRGRLFTAQVYNAGGRVMSVTGVGNTVGRLAPPRLRPMPMPGR